MAKINADWTSENAKRFTLRHKYAKAPFPKLTKEPSMELAKGPSMVFSKEPSMELVNERQKIFDLVLMNIPMMNNVTIRKVNDTSLFSYISFTYAS